MKAYSLGIAVSENNVVLIKKTKPEMQKDKLNFVGGKVEPGEIPIDCMVREFWEETGVQTSTSDWQSLGTMMRINDFIVHVFYAENEVFDLVQTTTEEKVHLFNRDMFLHYTDIRTLSNVKTLFEFSRSTDFRDYACQLHIVFPEVKNPTGEL